MSSKTLEKYQQEVKETAKKFNFDWSNYVQFIHLVEEVGELGEALTVQQGDRKGGSGENAEADHTSPENEIGDILFTVIELANNLNLDVSEIMEETFARYEIKLKNLQSIP